MRTFRNVMFWIGLIPIALLSWIATGIAYLIAPAKMKAFYKKLAAAQAMATDGTSFNSFTDSYVDNFEKFTKESALN